MFESRLLNGSSSKRRSGSLIIALAIETLCCSPPDNSWGKLLINFLSPVNSNTFSNFS